MWYVRPAMAQTSLCIRLSLEGSKTVGASRLKRRLHRLLLIYTCQKPALLEITCHGLNVDLLGQLDCCLYTELIKKRSTNFEIELLKSL